MAIERYDHYGAPRLFEGPKGYYLVRDVMTEDDRFAGICEYGVYDADGTIWTTCKEGSEFDQLRPFLPIGPFK